MNVKTSAVLVGATTLAIAISPMFAAADQTDATTTSQTNRVCLPILQDLLGGPSANANAASNNPFERVRLIIKNNCDANAVSDALSVSTRVGSAPLTVTFTAVVPANQPAGTTYALNYGDGASVTVNSTPGSYTLTHTYTVNGSYRATFAESSASNTNATVIGRATVFVGPIVSEKAPVLGRVVAPAYLKVGAQGTWKIADRLKSGDTTFSINWGDGTSSGSISNSANTGVFKHTYNATGTYTVTFTATNSAGTTTAHYPVIVVASKAAKSK